MKILVVVATPFEMKLIKAGIKAANIKSNLNIEYLYCGIWNYETIFAMENYLTINPEPTFIWNIWICGYRNPEKEKKSEPIQIATIMNIHTEKECIIPPFLEVAPMRNCFCSENVIFEKPIFEKKIWTINDERYFDMESRWIEFVASKHKLPRLILKVPFDFIGDETCEIYNNWKIDKEKMIQIWILLENLPYNDYLVKILERIKQQEKMENKI